MDILVIRTGHRRIGSKISAPAIGAEEAVDDGDRVWIIDDFFVIERLFERQEHLRPVRSGIVTFAPDVFVEQRIERAPNFFDQAPVNGAFKYDVTVDPHLLASDFQRLGVHFPRRFLLLGKLNKHE